MRARSYPVDPVDALVAARGWPKELADYARSRWQWQGGYLTGAVGRVLMPYRDHGGVVTGDRWRCPPSRCWRCRKRHPGARGWTKDARDDSKFPIVYGIWRIADEREVWLCEGETDAVWCGWALEPLGVGVLGLPGAGHHPRPEELELLRGRTVVLAVDADSAGEDARAKWSAALAGVARKVVDLHLAPGCDLAGAGATPVELRRALGS
jgi:hypothetical protein